MKTRNATLLGLIALVAALAALAGIATAGGSGHGSGSDESDHTDRSAELRKGVSFGEIKRHLERFQTIADANGGNRAAGFPGFDASANYVAWRLQKAGWDVERQSFEFDVFFQDEPTVFEQISPDAATYVEDTDYSTMEFSGSGDVTGELVAIDLQVPPPAEPGSTSGCEAADFVGSGVAGEIALMQRGSCDFRVKVDNAAAAGAAGAVIFNEGQPGRTDVVFGTLGGPNAAIPAVDTSFDLGVDLSNGVNDGATGTTVHIKTVTRSERRTAQNVIAETRRGDPDDVVMAGAHLDSVDEGPGINDNGSGSATLIEVAEQISEQRIRPENKLRFAWWGAEEQGLVGSTEYVAGLTEEEGADIALYLNFDMIGSPNFARLIYDGNGSKFGLVGPDGSGAIERTFQRYFDAQDLASGQTAFDGRSDYKPFIDVGIPAGGLFTGAEGVKTEAQQQVYGGTEGEAFDPCYHQACDDIDNISRRGLRQMSDAVAHAVHHYAFNLKFIPRPARATARHGRVTHSKYLGEMLRK